MGGGEGSKSYAAPCSLSSLNAQLLGRIYTKEMAAGIATSRHYAATLTQISCDIGTGLARKRIAVLRPEGFGSARWFPKTGVRFGLRLGLA